MHYGYLVVEGIDDAHFVGRLLGMRSMRLINNIAELDSFWADSQLIRREWPVGGDLLKRVDVPIFFQNNKYSIAVHSALGDGQIIRTVNRTLQNIDNLLQETIGIGVIMDADYDRGGARGRFAFIRQKIRDFLEAPEEPGQVLRGQPNTGIFVFPNNNNDGTIETILFECAREVYPNFLEGADHFVNEVNLDGLRPEDTREFLKPSGKNKAIVGCIGNILRPGRAIQVSVQVNRWVSEATLNIAGVSALNQFLSELFALD